MNRFLIALVLSLVIWAFAYGNGNAQQIVTTTPVPCTPYLKLVEVLEGQFNEQVVGRAVTGEGAGARMVEIWQGSDGSFSVVAVTPEGIGCLMLVGQDYESIPLKPGEEH